MAVRLRPREQCIDRARCLGPRVVWPQSEMGEQLRVRRFFISKKILERAVAVDQRIDSVSVMKNSGEDVSLEIIDAHLANRR